MKKHIGSVFHCLFFWKNSECICRFYILHFLPPQYLTASHKIVNYFTDYTNDKEIISFWRCTEL